MLLQLKKISIWGSFMDLTLELFIVFRFEAQIKKSFSGQVSRLKESSWLFTQLNSAMLLHDFMLKSFYIVPESFKLIRRLTLFAASLCLFSTLFDYKLINTYFVQYFSFFIFLFVLFRKANQSCWDVPVSVNASALWAHNSVLCLGDLLFSFGSARL